MKQEAKTRSVYKSTISTEIKEKLLNADGTKFELDQFIQVIEVNLVEKKD